MIVRLTIPGEPVPKGRPRFSRFSGRAYTPTKTRNFEAVVKMAGQAAMGDVPPLDCPLRFDVKIFMPIPMSWSIRKSEKALRGVA